MMKPAIWFSVFCQSDQIWSMALCWSDGFFSATSFINARSSTLTLRHTQTHVQTLCVHFSLSHQQFFANDALVAFRLFALQHFTSSNVLLSMLFLVLVEAQSLQQRLLQKGSQELIYRISMVHIFQIYDAHFLLSFTWCAQNPEPYFGTIAGVFKRNRTFMADRSYCFSGFLFIYSPLLLCKGWLVPSTASGSIMSNQAHQQATLQCWSCSKLQKSLLWS